MVNWKKHRKFLAVLGLFTAIQAVIVAMRWDRALVWDSSVYVGMGKHLYTLGEIGVWESFRPPVLPTVIGAVWKTGLFFPNLARITAVAISATGATAFYKMIEKEFDIETAFYAAAILMSSFVFLRWGHYLLTGIPAALLGFAAIYYANRRKAVTAGLLASLAFLTRFPAALATPAAALTLALKVVPLEQIRKLEVGKEEFIELFREGFKMGASFSVLPLTYFTLNWYYGKGFLSPILSGASVPLLNPDKYLYGLYFLKEAAIANPLILFAIPGIYLVVRNRDSVSYGYLAGLAAFYLFFTFYPHKEPRFMLAFLPMLALFAGIGIRRINLSQVEELYESFGLSRETLVLMIAAVVMLVNAVALVGMNSWSNPERNEFLQETSGLNGTVAGLNPAPVVYGDFRFMAVRPEHYENTTERVFRQADYFAYESAAWYCSPAIENCEDKQDELVDRLEQYNKIFETSNGEHNYSIYRLNQR